MTRLTATLLLILLTTTAGVSSFQQLVSRCCSNVRLTRTRHNASVSNTSVTTGEQGRRHKKAVQKRLNYERRRNAWLERYGTFQALQKTFGAGPIWGDLSPEQTRRLYHTLLPRSLLGLAEMGVMKPEELAPLAYEARIAAKHYARSRCVWTARLATSAFDQYRNLRDRGRFGRGSMTWDEIWQKYEGQIVEEECTEDLGKEKQSKLDKDTLTMRIYLRILERSCATNQAFDRIFLKESEDDDQHDSDLEEIAYQLEKDVLAILLRRKEGDKAMKKLEKAEKELLKEKEKQQKALAKEQKKRLKAERKEEEKRLKVHEEMDYIDVVMAKNATTSLKQKKALVKERKKQLEAERKEEKKRRKRLEKMDDGATVVAANATTTAAKDEKRTYDTSPQNWEVLRILAGTRRHFRLLLGENSTEDV